MTTEKEWEELSPDEKREERFKKWLSPANVKFSSTEAEGEYKARVTRFIKAIKLEEPDRVPVMMPVSNLPAYYAGANLKTVMYDYDELRRSWIKFLHEFEMDAFSGPGLVYPGKVLESTGYRLHHWPGHGLGDDAPSYQYIEGEYMAADEYDAFIKDPADFLLTKFLPRTTPGLAGFGKLGPMTQLMGVPVFFISQFADPEVRESMRVLLDAALETVKWRDAVADVSKAAREAGLPPFSSAMSGAPFDRMGDTLRGTKGIMMDMYRRPEQLQEAMERIAPMIIDQTLRMAKFSESPVVTMPLHKGPGGFMSGKQFETFYWPTLKKVMMAFIEEGLVPMPFAEGDYEPRLDIIKEMPKGSVIWHFEVMNMMKAKKTLGGHACILGNLPVSVLCTGTPSDVKEGCRKLIETCAPGGGYILGGSAAIDQGDPANLRAMMEAAKEFGVYRKQF